MGIPRECFTNVTAELSHHTHASVVRIFMCREIVAKVLNINKNFMQVFVPKYYFVNPSKAYRAPVLPQLWDVCESVANLLPRNFVEFTMRKFLNIRTTFIGNSLEKTCKQLMTIWRENKTKRHWQECCETLS